MSNKALIGLIVIVAAIGAAIWYLLYGRAKVTTVDTPTPPADKATPEQGYYTVQPVIGESVVRVSNQPEVSNAVYVSNIEPYLMTQEQAISTGLITPVNGVQLACGEGGWCGDPNAYANQQAAHALAGGEYDWTGLWIPYGQPATIWRFGTTQIPSATYIGGPKAGMAVV